MNLFAKSSRNHYDNVMLHWTYFGKINIFIVFFSYNICSQIVHRKQINIFIIIILIELLFQNNCHLIKRIDVRIKIHTSIWFSTFPAAFISMLFHLWKVNRAILCDVLHANTHWIMRGEKKRLEIVCVLLVIFNWII